MKNKKVAAVLALMFGVFGVHRFYLGKRFWGILHLGLFFFCMALTIEEGVPAIMLPALIGFIDAILFFVMPPEDFDERYNRKYLNNSYRQEATDFRRERKTRKRQPAHPPRSNPYKKRGIERFRDYDYEGAIEDFHKALDYNENDPAVHFNLGCCYSILEEMDPALDHLEQAVALGFRDLEKIKTHNALAFLRSQPEFEVFVENGFQKIAQLPEPEPDLLSTETQKEDDLLDQIVKLGALRDQGILTEEEFAVQKKKILGE
ncbi:MAG: hypothetical protein DHS20C18_22250 [Saprospiraceae bacterium]|nr:MAG: hypothetical protein DHS20C18_22250 [Saprospiraceae bacterium]